MAAMARDAGVGLAELRVDGGASVNALAMQFQADMLGVPVVRPRIRETTALGAAYLAGLHVGIWPDIETITHQRAEDARFTPRTDSAYREALLAGWHRAVAQSRSDIA